MGKSKRNHKSSKNIDKKSKIAIITSVLALAIVVISVTYAYFSARITGLESASTISLTAGTMGIHYSEGNEQVSFSNIYPKNEAWVTKTFTLTANNTTTLTMYYEVGLNVTTNTFPNDYLTYDLTLISSTNGTPIANKTNVPINGTGRIKFGKGSFTNASNDTHNYELKIYFKESGEDQNDAQNAIFNAKIYVEEAFADITWANPGTGTLLAGIKNTNPTVHLDSDTGMTIPGQQKSSGAEGLRMAEDDYGTSYYYRGAVDNNYVLFANMCWRIVRVDGESNIKMVLFNYNSDKVNNTNPCTENGGSYAMARYSSEVTGAWNSKFNTTSTSNAYVGFMYGTPGSSTYDDEHENTNKSFILTSLETWYQNNLGANSTTDYTNYLADVVWCNDKSLSDVQVGGQTGYLNSGISNESTFYAASKRLYSQSNYGDPSTTNTPTFRCPDASGTDTNLSRFTITTSEKGNKKLTYPIGLLTVDEVAYAGAIAGSNNSSMYLTGNASCSQCYWWTMTPERFLSGSNNNAKIFMVSPSGFITSYEVTGYTLPIRPAISLKPSVKIDSTGDGTRTTPFVVMAV